MKCSKVFGVGFHKTGTSTLGACLRLLGYNHISSNKIAFLLYLEPEMNGLLSLINHFDSFEDWPWALIYKEAYERYPDSKFILTTRRNEEVWYSSLVNHVRRGDGEYFKYRKHIYGYENPEDNKKVHIDKYRQHNRAVRSFFEDKQESFLEVCWENGDGWNELCSFLKLEVPNAPFPHEKQSARKGMVRELNERGRMAARVLVGRQA